MQFNFFKIIWISRPLNFFPWGKKWKRDGEMFRAGESREILARKWRHRLLTKFPAKKKVQEKTGNAFIEYKELVEFLIT
jgi:hypothetical protein